jgi:hypothetical protein
MTSMLYEMSDLSNVAATEANSSGNLSCICFVPSAGDAVAFERRGKCRDRLFVKVHHKDQQVNTTGTKTTNNVGSAGQEGQQQGP